MSKYPHISVEMCRRIRRADLDDFKCNTGCLTDHVYHYKLMQFPNGILYFKITTLPLSFTQSPPGFCLFTHLCIFIMMCDSTTISRQQQPNSEFCHWIGHSLLHFTPLRTDSLLYIFPVFEEIPTTEQEYCWSMTKRETADTQNGLRHYCNCNLEELKTATKAVTILKLCVYFGHKEKNVIRY